MKSLENKLLNYQGNEKKSIIVAGQSYEDNKCEIPNEWLEDSISFRFEDSESFIPRMYNENLTMWYGDYMSLPPENERCGHYLKNGTIIYDDKKDYSIYKNGDIE